MTLSGVELSSLPFQRHNPMDSNMRLLRCSSLRLRKRSTAPG
jgi:hypothetical protein